MPHQNRLEGDRGEQAPQCCRLQLLPNHAALSRAWPCRSRYCLTVTALRAAGKANALRAAVCNDYPGRPCPAPPRLTTTTLQREQQGTPKCSVLPSAAIARPVRTAPGHAIPRRDSPHQNHSPKRAAEEAEASCAAVCNCRRTLPRRTAPGTTEPGRTRPCLLSKESSREPRKAPCCRLQRLPYRAAPRLAEPRLA